MISSFFKIKWDNEDEDNIWTHFCQHKVIRNFIFQHGKSNVHQKDLQNKKEKVNCIKTSGNNSNRSTLILFTWLACRKHWYYLLHLELRTYLNSNEGVHRMVKLPVTQFMGNYSNNFFFIIFALHWFFKMSEFKEVDNSSVKREKNQCWQIK